MVLLSERCLGTDGGENLLLASLNTNLSTGAQVPTLRYLCGVASTLRMRGQLLLASLSAATSQITESRIDPAEINDERLGWF